MSDSTLIKHPKIEKTTDYIQWQRRVKAYLRKGDYAFIYLTDRTAEDVIKNVLHDWNAKMPSQSTQLFSLLGTPSWRRQEHWL